MQEQLEQFWSVLAAGAVAAIGAKRVGIPYNVALVLVGLLLVFMNVLPYSPLNPEVVLVAFLPILVFEGALFADVDALQQASRPILALALPGVGISLLGTAAVAMFGLKLSFPVAILLGSLLAITDTVSVLLAFRSVRIPQRLVAIMEGESLFNDGTALVLVSLAVQAVAEGGFVATEIGKDLLVVLVGGVAIGALVGAVGSLVLRATPDHLTAILASTVLVFATSLLAEHLHASPVIAVVVTGLMVGKEARRVMKPSRVMALQGFWEVIGFAVNVVLFLLVGMQIQARMLIEEAGSIALALVALHVGRAVAVYGCFFLLRVAVKEKVPLRWQHVMVVGNIKGALSMAAVLALPQSLPHRERLVAIVFGVTFVTLVTQALPFRSLLKYFRVTLSPVSTAVDEAKATLLAARRGLASLEEFLTAGLLARKAHAERRAAFQRLVIEAEEVLRVHESSKALDPLVDISILHAQRAALMEAGRHGLVDVEIANEQIELLNSKLIALSHNEE